MSDLTLAFTPSTEAFLKGKTLFITGASRGIGRAIALRAAADGANIVVVAKTSEPHPKLPGTIHSVAEEVRAAGGQALPILCDIRDDAQIAAAIAQAVEHFGGIDILVNNASAISLTGTLDTSMKRYDLMHQINVRGTFAVSRAALPHLLRAPNPHILALSPPLAIKPAWFGPHPAYTMSKYGMSMCMLGLAEEFRSQAVAVNALWPQTVISTSALQAFAGDQLSELHKKSRTAAIVADAAYAIFCQPSASFSGVFCIDESVLRAQNIQDLRRYALDPTPSDHPFNLDLFVEERPPAVPRMKQVLLPSARSKI